MMFASKLSWPAKKGKGEETYEARKGEWFLCLPVPEAVVEVITDMDAVERDRIEYELRQDLALVRAVPPA